MLWVSCNYVLCCFRFEFVPVDGQDVVKVYGLVTLPKEEIYVHLHQRKKFV